MPFSPEELARYQRQLSLSGFGRDAQERLKRGSVLVVGAGGLGCPALLYLAAAGIGHITILDPDRVEVSNLQRQVLYTEADAGQLKSTAAARRLRELNPWVKVEARAERLSRDNALKLIGAHEVTIDGSDNFATRYLVNDACVLTGRPFVYGAIQGFEGQLSVFNWKDGPTYRCLFPEPPPPGTVPNCAEAGVLGALPGLIGTAQACEALKLIAGVGEPLSGRLVLWDALSMSTRTITLAVDPRSRDIRELPPEGYGEVCDTAEDNREIDVRSLRTLLRGEPAPQLIDVRETWERIAGTIDPHVHIPMEKLDGSDAAAALARLDPAAPTVVYCAVGVRSLRAVQLLRERHKFDSALSLRGGYQEWARWN
jgi:molybdopterin/thiamine biosynthesis adenylyltransferase/rhodanese-related sulfurtransferase